MFKLVSLQALGILIVVALVGGLFGTSAAMSALAGGLAYVLPNLLFVLRLRLGAVTGTTSAASFLLGEFVKLLSVIALLVSLPLVKEVVWPALIAGLFVVLFVNLFALLLKT